MPRHVLAFGALLAIAVASTSPASAAVASSSEPFAAGVTTQGSAGLQLAQDHHRGNRPGGPGARPGPRPGGPGARPGPRPGFRPGPPPRPGFGAGPGRPPGFRPGPVVGPGFGRPGRPGYVRRWSRRPYFGTIIGGVALGGILTAAAIGYAPPPPAPGLCWYWTDPGQSQGYWDYCE